MKRLVAMAIVALAAGCSSIPQDGSIGLVYCGNNTPIVTGRCPCTHELRVSIHGFTCVPLAEVVDLDGEEGE